MIRKIVAVLFLTALFSFGCKKSEESGGLGAILALIGLQQGGGAPTSSGFLVIIPKGLAR
jgi:hypothetical protein